MSRIFAVVFILLLFTASCKNDASSLVVKNPYYLSGEIEDSLKIDKLLAFVISDSSDFHIDTLDVVDGKFLLKDFSDTLTQINLYYRDNKYFSVYLQKTDSSHIHILADKDSCYFTNDTVNSALYEFMYENGNFMKKINGDTPFSDSLKIKVKENITNFIDNNYGNIASSLILKEFLIHSYDSMYVNTEIGRIPVEAKPGLILNQIITFNKIASYPILNRRIPALSVTDSNKTRFNINELSGSYTILSFWASWDTASVSYIKELNKISKDFKGKNLEFVSISLDNNDSIWMKNVAKFKIPGRNYRVNLGFADDNSIKYSVRSLPTNIIADKRVYYIKRDLFGKDLTDYLKKVVEDKKKEKEKNTKNSNRNKSK